MILSYMVRDVEPDAICSYPRGRTLLNNTGGIFTDHEEAERVARNWNSHCHTPGITYRAVRHDENLPFPADQYEKP